MSKAGLRLTVVLLGLVSLAGCPGDSEDPLTKKKDPTTVEPVPVQLTPELIAANNRGVGLMEQYKYNEARKAFQALVDRQPAWHDVRVNLAIAVLNETQKGAEAVPILEAVLAAEKDHVAATYCLGLSLFHANRTPEALVHFRRSVEQNPRDAFAAYFVARCIEHDKPQEATTWYQKALELEPYFKSAHYRCWDLLRQDKKYKKAGKHMEEFSLLRQHPLSVGFEYKYTLMGPLAEAIRVGLPAAEQPPAKGLVLAAPRLLPGGDRLAVPASASLTSCDINADGRQDLFVTGAVTGRNAVLIGQDGGSFTHDDQHPLAAIRDVRAALWGDFDNDGLVDVYLCCAGPNQLWRQSEPGKWQDVTGSTKSAAGDDETVDGVCLDLDHDADLDLLLIGRSGPARLLNNNRDGTFQDISQKTGVDRKGQATQSAVVADFDGDRDLDILLLGTAGKEKTANTLLWNDREWRYHADEQLGELAGAAIRGAVAGDANADGLVELYAVEATKVVRWQRAVDGRWSRQTLSTPEPLAISGTVASVQLALADVTGDGSLDLLVGTHGWSAWQLPRDVAGTALKPLTDSGEHDPLAGWTMMLLEHARGPSVVGATVDGAPVVWNAGPGRYPFLSISLSGKKKGSFRERSNASGLGNQLRARIGGHTVHAASLPACNGPGQNLQPVSVGLGRAQAADYVKIIWSEGVTQGQLDLVAGTCHQIVEEDRMPTSCPVLFVWDGQKYRFVSDLLAVGGLGYLVEPGTYAPPDPTENFLLPAGMAGVAGGRYRLKLTEPMPELTYLDRAGLTAWDLPPGWQMTLDERLATASPDPSGRPVFFQNTQSPHRVTNDRGQDVTDQVATVDHRAAEVGPLDRRFLGRLVKEHVLVLEFEEPLDAGPGRPVLVADGWVEFPFSQTAFSAWQAGASLDPPTLEARDAQGRWIVVAPTFGYPGGMPRQMALPLSSLPRGTRALRLRTNLEIYWDRLTVVRAEACPSAVRRSLGLVEADLRESGFMDRQVKEQFRPHFDYGQRAAHPEIIDPEGFYTRFGVVNELVETTDDAVAIFGPGEEIHLEFMAPKEAVTEGWTRRLVLETVGWCKDMDLYTGDGATVGPLPSTGAPNALRDRLHRRYNTRYQRGW